MRALQLLQSGPLTPERLQSVKLPKPEPGPGQIWARVHACGICRTDPHTAAAFPPNAAVCALQRLAASELRAAVLTV